MSAAEPNLTRAIAKLLPQGRDCWGAPLTPAEIVALATAGAVPSMAGAVERARERVAKGESGQTWFYFSPRRVLRTQILKAKQ